MFDKVPNTLLFLTFLKVPRIGLKGEKASGGLQLDRSNTYFANRNLYPWSCDTETKKYNDNFVVFYTSILFSAFRSSGGWHFNTIYRESSFQAFQRKQEQRQHITGNRQPNHHHSTVCRSYWSARSNKVPIYTEEVYDGVQREYKQHTNLIKYYHGTQVYKNQGMSYSYIVL